MSVGLMQSGGKLLQRGGVLATSRKCCCIELNCCPEGQILQHLTQVKCVESNWTDLIHDDDDNHYRACNPGTGCVQEGYNVTRNGSRSYSQYNGDYIAKLFRQASSGTNPGNFTIETDPDTIDEAVNGPFTDAWCAKFMWPNYGWYWEPEFVNQTETLIRNVTPLFPTSNCTDDDGDDVTFQDTDAEFEYTPGSAGNQPAVNSTAKPFGTSWYDNPNSINLAYTGPTGATQWQSLIFPVLRCLNPDVDPDDIWDQRIYDWTQADRVNTTDTGQQVDGVSGCPFPAFYARDDLNRYVAGINHTSTITFSVVNR